MPERHYAFQPPAKAGQTAAFGAFLRAVERVEEVVGQETEALRQHRIDGLGDFNHRKSYGLLELTRAVRALGVEATQAETKARLHGLRLRLDENAETLRMHLSAVQEVSSVMARAIRDGESDGTYSSAFRFNGHKA